MNRNILIKNIYYMIAYAFDTIDFNIYENMKSEEFEYIDDLFASLLVVGMNSQIKKGLSKNYIPFSEELAIVRGKINLSDSIKMNSLMKNRLICEYDEYNENILLNQIIKTILFNLLNSSNVSKKNKRNIKRVLLYMDKISFIDLSFIKLDKLQIPRHHSDYRVMIYIAYLYQQNHIFSNSQNGLLFESLDNSAELHKLFENFVRNFYKKHYSMLYPGSRKFNWNSENESGLLPEMKTDINLDGATKCLIIDTKFYQNIFGSYYDTKKLLSNHIYQIYSYLSNVQDNKTTLGMVLYAQTEHEDKLDTRERIGNFTIYFKSIDLNTPFKSIQKSLHEIAEIVQ